MIIVYLKMQLKYAHSNGYLKFDGLCPTFEEEIAIDIEESVENVRMTLAFLARFDFLQQVSEYEYFIVEMQNRIGSKTDAAIRMEKMRSLKALNKLKIE